MDDQKTRQNPATAPVRWSIKDVGSLVKETRPSVAGDQTQELRAIVRQNVWVSDADGWSQSY